MPRRKWIDKKTATHYTLVHRPQNDPLIHDESAPSMVLNPTRKSWYAKVSCPTTRGSDDIPMRDNEGEAAQYGIYFDDTQYDYMQHLRDPNEGGGEAVYIEATAPSPQRWKDKQSLDDALRDLDLQSNAKPLLDEDILPSKNLRKQTYQAQQDIPDAIAGFQPDMDPRLREVLEALDDEAYVQEDDDNDMFQELAQDGMEIDEEDFVETLDKYDDDDGWGSDGAVKATTNGSEEATKRPPTQAKQASLPNDMQIDQPIEGPAQDWLDNFKRFKHDQKLKGTRPSVVPSFSEAPSSLLTGGRRKKRKGALTNASNFSMTSSTLPRTEHQRLLDARYEKLREDYQRDLDERTSVSEVSSVASQTSTVQEQIRSDFDSILDEFLGQCQPDCSKKGGKQRLVDAGIKQLDEIRKGLGPAKVRPSMRYT